MTVSDTPDPTPDPTTVLAQPPFPIGMPPRIMTLETRTIRPSPEDLVDGITIGATIPKPGESSASVRNPTGAKENAAYEARLIKFIGIGIIIEMGLLSLLWLLLGSLGRVL